ncbi:MAG: hypothetical protein JSS04_11600 [Proteobacteria bacterium]|nr:hypothetical protein [Pseudomonadota bacterium]
MGKFTLAAATAAALFAAGVTVTARADGKVKCGGINSCKGTSSCKTALSSCKGKNSCKGLGWSTTSSEQECTSKGGKVL